MISFGIVTWNSADVIAGCLASVRQQWGVSAELLVWDNASTDGTRTLLDQLTRPDERMYADANHGFAAAHNALIARSRGTYYVALNPDVVLASSFAAKVTRALDGEPQAGSATGKLARLDDPRIIDSTGIQMLRSQRHVDRGADMPDTGQFDRAGYVFGASGAAACYRRAMLEDVRLGHEYFDEDFFAYREDADLAWRAQLFGWRCLYVPSARAWHARRVTPERRAVLPASINRLSVRNRFLLRLKNQTVRHALTFAGPGLWRDAQVIGYVLLRERTSIPGLLDVIRCLPRALAKRRQIMRRRRTGDEEIIRWFRGA